MARQTVYNTTAGPLVVDDEGHTVDGHSRREDVDTDGRTASGSYARELLDAGALIVPEDKPATAHSNADAEEPAESKPATARASRSNASDKE